MTNQDLEERSKGIQVIDYTDFTSNWSDTIAEVLGPAEFVLSLEKDLGANTETASYFLPKNGHITTDDHISVHVRRPLLQMRPLEKLCFKLDLRIFDHGKQAVYSFKQIEQIAIDYDSNLIRFNGLSEDGLIKSVEVSKTGELSGY